MDLKEMYREIVNEHNLHPSHKYDLSNPTIQKRGVNPSCGDDITLKLVVRDGVIEDGAYTGEGCAISQASADMMLDLLIGKTVEEAETLTDIFNRMIKGEVTEEELESLEDAQSLFDISHMPARVKCALLSWRTFDEMVKEES